MPGATAYRVYRNGSLPVPRDAGHLITCQVPSATTCQNTTTIWGAYYVVVGVNLYGEGGPSTADRADEWCSNGNPLPTPTLTPTPTPTRTPTWTPTPTPTPAPPAAPGNLVACIAGMVSGGGGTVYTNRLTWTAAAGATSYNVYRHSSSPVPIDAGHRVGSGVTGTLYNDNVSTVGLYYAVTGVNAAGEGGASNTDRANEWCSLGASLPGAVEDSSAAEESTTAEGESAALPADGTVTQIRYYYFNGQRVARVFEAVGAGWRGLWTLLGG